MFQAQIYQDQEQVDDIIYDAMDLFWHEYLLKNMQHRYFPHENSSSKCELIEKMFIKASQLAPYRLDLLYDVAFIKALQSKAQEAIEVYQQILRTYSQAYNAGILEAVYSKVTEGNEVYEKKINKYMKTHPKKTQNFKNAVRKVELGLRKVSFDQIPFKIDRNNHIIVVLGYVLNEDGSMKDPLISRLQKSLEMYRSNPGSKILLTGGFPKAGRTQSYMMMNWLIQADVPKQDLILEEESKDTLGNAVYSIPKLKAADAQVVTIVTSSSHMRRAMLLFDAVSEQKGFNPDYRFLVDPDVDISEVTQVQELSILRDVLRAWGIWALPGLFK